MNPRDRFLAACRNEETDFTPVWFMRQAGRYLDGYKKLRKKHSVVEICKTPSLCEQTTLMPLKELGVDAAVMFGDIMLPLEGLGIQYRIEENLGPVISNPISGLLDVQRLRKFEAKRDVPYVLDSIRLVRRRLDDTAHALIGFSGAPFTIASYLIEGQSSRDYAKTKKFMFDEKEAWHELMSILSEMTVEYLSEQIKAGVDAVQIFDSWVGALSLEDYEEYVAPFVGGIFRSLKKEFPNTPTVHFSTGTFHLLKVMKEKTGGDVYSIDWRIPIQTAREVLGKGIAIQGNLEPSVLLSRDTDSFVKRRVQRVLQENGSSSGHIFNLGHGILKDTPVETAKFVVQYVHGNS